MHASSNLTFQYREVSGRGSKDASLTKVLIIVVCQRGTAVRTGEKDEEPLCVSAIPSSDGV
ncbi:hypothetical protein PISMIDRAFT_679663 [Pisolithus microcarpus 441]|uniref:Unplaced genomic scaffold scaffold_47, whole genome shotgun sequence n=1 Tax=Pisolithus microcarpus 441 TaxID=765257 RepID=A0A0C9Z200_9AGAM|nr:hypothetical protein PISMIDRAFT_679663 [Pisolithus microcarpus 441]